MSRKWKNNIIQQFQMLQERILFLESIEDENLMDFLQALQEKVIEIGNSIEMQVAECEQIIETLTNLAERIYELSLDGNYKKYGMLQSAKELCCLAEMQAKERIPDTYEILFMPYKVSMWDCMETIYEAATKDDDCHVTVMPVPYYSVNEDRTDVEITYEGKLFSQNIAITDYRNYSIASMLPDVIFIHNPYDGCNRVTQLPEQYFSKELRRYTDKLIYIPYKVCRGKVKDIYCMLPGVRNAWRVFVQSESVRENYVKYNEPERIVVTGSPKIDKIIQNMNYPPEVPAEWMEALQGRKVFLLNTHLNSIMNQAEAFLLRLEMLMDVFDGRGDIALLWRPHPLSIETAKAMNPDILQSYLGIVERFKAFKNGVYDESSSPHMAIALSDAYIGDGSSSLLTMFGMTGRPIYVWNRKAKAKSLAEQGEKRKYVYYETMLGMEDYISLVCEENDAWGMERKGAFQKIFYRADGNSGKMIWEYVREYL